MKPNAEQIEQIQILLTTDDAAVTFYKKGTDESQGYWYLTNNGVSEAGPVANKDGDLKFYKDRTIADFLAFVQNNEVNATVNLTSRVGEDEPFEDWEHLARYMGITDLVVLSTKVPKRVAAKFQYYATMSTTVSEKMRSLVYEYVKQEIKDNAESDMFR